MSAELVRHDQFQFKGQRLPLIHDDRGRFVSFARACHMLGLDLATEWARVQQDASMAFRTRVEYDPQTDSAMYYMRADAIPMWVALIPTARMPVEMRKLHTAFKNELIDAVYDFTTKGVAIKPGTPSITALKEVGEYVLKLNPTDKTKLLVTSAIESELARIAGRSSVAEMPVTVAARLQERNISLGKKAVMQIGMEMATQYRRSTGREPSTFPQFIDGAMRHVKSYTAADVPLLDRVIDTFMRRPKSSR